MQRSSVTPGAQASPLSFYSVVYSRSLVQAHRARTETNSISYSRRTRAWNPQISQIRIPISTSSEDENPLSRLSYCESYRKGCIRRGPTRAKGRHWKGVCYEVIAKRRDVETRSGNIALNCCVKHIWRWLFVARSCSRRAGCPCRINIAMGCTIILFLPGPTVSLPHHGISSRRRFDDDADEVRCFLRRCHKVLHGRVYSGHRGCSRTRIYPSVCT